MNRRGFLKFLGIAPSAVYIQPVAAAAIVAPAATLAGADWLRVAGGFVRVDASMVSTPVIGWMNRP